MGHGMFCIIQTLHCLQYLLKENLLKEYLGGEGRVHNIPVANAAIAHERM